ncbi:hypothetical protein BKA61DRAFT_670512 [Leptodontidium sp. MPI-SDFR-AT-0119]|nr:hypothetical protein BKA61DRAFT_670512 [Leptodontidium sp. MPI-SDFR-AT-0119]
MERGLEIKTYFPLTSEGTSGQFSQYTPHPGGMEALLAAPMGAFHQDGTDAGNQDVFSNNGKSVPSQFPQYNTNPGQLDNIQAGKFNSLSQNVTVANNFNQQNSSNLDEDLFGFDQGMDLSFGFGGRTTLCGDKWTALFKMSQAFNRTLRLNKHLLTGSELPLVLVKNRKCHHTLKMITWVVRRTSVKASFRLRIALQTYSEVLGRIQMSAASMISQVMITKVMKSSRPVIN